MLGVAAALAIRFALRFRVHRGRAPADRAEQHVEGREFAPIAYRELDRDGRGETA